MSLMPNSCVGSSIYRYGGSRPLKQAADIGGILCAARAPKIRNEAAQQLYGTAKEQSGQVVMNIKLRYQPLNYRSRTAWTRATFNNQYRLIWVKTRHRPGRYA